ncbi:iron-sulfur cluster biosynthesis family protein [Enterococcus sp. LJL120]
MEIKMSPEVEKKLAPYQQDAKLLLDLDDGVGSFSKFGVCSLDTSFRVLVVAKDSDLKDYPTALTSPIGDLYIKEYTSNYFAEEPVLELNPRFQNLVLKTASGTVDGNVEIIDMRALQSLQK